MTHTDCSHTPFKRVSYVKLALMFVPLILLFSAIVLITQDARSPVTLRDQCRILAAGPDASRYRKGSTLLYSHSENPLYHLALSCDSFPQPLMVNDEQLMHTPVKKGQQAELLGRRYRFLPQRWIISIHTGEQTMLDQAVQRNR